MHLLSLAIGLPLALATFEIPQGYSHQLSARNGQRSQPAPGPATGYTTDVCHDGVDYTFPFCKTDADCQRDSEGHSNLPPSQSPYYNLLIEYGHGSCKTHTDETTGKTSCAAGFRPTDDLRPMCEAMLTLYSQYVDGLKLKSMCYIDEHSFACDMLCDPTVNPKCQEDAYFEISCNGFATGNGTFGPCSWSCPDSKLDAGEHWSGEPPQPDPRPIEKICKEQAEAYEKAHGGGGDTPAPPDSVAPSPGSSGDKKKGEGKKHKHSKKHHGAHHKAHKHN